MVAKRRTAPHNEESTPQAAAAVVLPFPAGKPAEAKAPTGVLPSAPEHGERPTFVAPRLREWLLVTLIVSVAVHALAYLAFQWRFEDDLERAAGAAAALSSDGTVTIPVDIIVEAMLPSAPAPTDASESEIVQPSPPTEQTDVEIDDLMPPIPEPAPVVLPEMDFARRMPPPQDPAPVVLPKPPVFAASMMPPPPEPAPIVLPTRAEAARLALPEEETAPPQPVETASIPEGPARSAGLDEEPPMPAPRDPPPPPEQATKPPEKRQQGHERKQAARSAPSKAASPSRAAAANSTGRAGAGGTADAGGRAAISSYQAQVLAHLSRHRVYPPEARARSATGVARVRFALGRDGRVLSASLVGGSGERVLDQAAVTMVRRASPFPPFPSGLSRSRMDFAAPIRFDLR